MNGLTSTPDQAASAASIDACQDVSELLEEDPHGIA
jgi:hypothetical protein